MAFLQVESSDGQTQKYELSAERVVIGRSDDADVVVASTRASRHHASVEKTPEGHWQLKDLGSSNKTFVNKQPVSTHVLRNGDIFLIGGVPIRFVESAPMAKSAAPVKSPSKSQPQPLVRTKPPKEDTYDVADEPAVCPSCKAVVAPSAVLCVKCGYNLKTGQRMAGIAAPVLPGQPASTGDGESGEPKVCPCCQQTLPPSAKICVKCGVDVQTGRSIMTTQGNSLDEIYMMAESTIRWVSWLIMMGVYPIASEAFGLRKPWATRGIAALTVLVSAYFFVAYAYNPDPSASAAGLMLWTGDADSRRQELESAKQEIEQSRERLRAKGMNDRALDRVVGRLDSEAVNEFHPYQLLTHALLHGGLIHLAGNMLFLMVLGSRVNALIGNVLTLVLYPILAIIAGFAHMLSVADQPLMPMLGASGAVMGLAGMYLVLMPTPKVHMAAWVRWGLIGGFHLSLRTFAVRGFWCVLFYIAFDVVYTVFGMEDDVAHWAHLGGFLSGMAFGLILLFSRLINARGGDLLSVLLGKRAWALIGKPNRPTPNLW